MGEAKRRQMECPVLGRRIKPAECGEKRISQYDCPESCPNNPWRAVNYEQIVQSIARFHEKLVVRLKADMEAQGDYSIPPVSELDGISLKQLLWIHNKAYQATNSQGSTFFERLAAEHFRGFNNDQRILLQAEAGTRPVLFEVHQIVDDCLIRGVDLLDPERNSFCIADPFWASRLCRFSTHLFFVYDLPSFCVINYGADAVEYIAGKEVAEVFAAILEHLEAPSDSLARNRWLFDHTDDVAESFSAIREASLVSAIARIEKGYLRRIYDVNMEASSLKELLEAEEDLVESGGEWHCQNGYTDEWICYGSDEQDEFLAGRFFLHAEGHVLLETSAQKGMDFMVRRLEELLGDRAQYSETLTDAFVQEMLCSCKGDYDQALVPPGLIPSPEPLPKLQCIPADQRPVDDLEDHQTYWESFLDERMQWLNGATPRQAACDPNLRGALLTLMKHEVRYVDEENLEEGLQEDINWVLTELGLDEIHFPPPPPRAIPDYVDAYSDEDDDWEDDHFVVLPEVLAGRQKILDEQGNEALLAAYEKNFPAAKQLISDTCLQLNEEALEAQMQQLAARIAYTLLVPGHEPQDYDLDTMLDDNLDYVLDCVLDMDEGADNLAQPHVASWIFEEVEKMARFGSEDPNYDKLTITMLAWLETVNDLFNWGQNPDA